ncbi:MAG: four helix bundle protein [Minisyncoccus archaeiphilus]|uniref:diversity-generating retroelement protein Avd n=1 Tax=Minisyncoccus archaeiphilus TaxID=3238481 RepID=UPI002B09641C|nr:MAG: four helix bundle protein [Candidatus Parcubacteria bacterium]
MLDYSDLVIFQKSYDLTLRMYPVISRFPKNQRYVLGQRIENILVSMILDIVEINKERGRDRSIKMKVLSDNLDDLKVLVRLAKDLRFISIKKYAIFIEKISEIGKLLGGWQKTLI